MDINATDPLTRRQIGNRLNKLLARDRDAREMDYALIKLAVLKDADADAKAKRAVA